MKHLARSLRLLKLFILVACLMGFTFLEFALGVTKIHAQSSESWTEAVNLSQSGSSSNPSMVVDSDGVFHIVWKDEYAGDMYVSGDGVDWGQSAAVNFPFIGEVPELIADKDGFVHAFWMDSTNRLFYSSVRGINFALASSWTPPVQLGESAFDIGVTLDQNGDLHLIYIRPLDSTEFPSGVYYRKLETGDAGWVWSPPTMIYSTPYFRSIELEDTHVDIASSRVGGEDFVYAVWDNQPRERVYLAKSTDAGQTWGSPEEIDKPDNTLGYSSTSEILVNAYNQDVLLVWQRSSSGGTCGEYYQQSNDGGDTWSKPEEIIRESLSCGQDERLISDGNGLIYLWTILQNQVTLVAWDRQQWSNPQVQNELSAFTDLETQKSVTYDCRQPVLNGSDRLAVVGCDTNGGADIWFTDRLLGDVSSWFSAQSDWSNPQEFVNGQIAIESPVLLAAPDNDLVALWSQKSQEVSSEQQSVINYASWNGDGWTESVPIIRSSLGNLTQPDAAIDEKGRILTVWSSNDDGKVYFDWADITNAQNPAEWDDPIPLSNSQLSARSPEILVSKSGVIYVVYAVAVNEGRGVYLTRSMDDGASWTSPVQIFDGVAANWQMVDNPQLVETQDGVLHALWSPRSISDDSGFLGLYYAQSDDGGNTWSSAQAVADEAIMWSQIASFEQGSLFRIWQEGGQIQPVIKYQFSHDSGLTWSPDESLGSFGEKSLMAKLVADPTGNLHMLQIVQDSTGELILRHWLWESGRWSINELFDLAGELTEKSFWMDSTASMDGTLATIFAAKVDTEAGHADSSSMYFTNRSWGLLTAEPGQSIATATTSPVIPAIDSSEIVPEETLVTQATPTPDFSALISNESPAASSSSFMGVGRGVFLSILIIGAAVIFGVWKKRRG